jgi:hypothetical protein
MKSFVLAIILFSTVCSTAHSQELYIVSNAAANISKNRIEVRNIARSYDDLKAFHYDFQLNYGLLGNLTIYNNVTYTTDSDYEFLGNYNVDARYRFLDIDKANFHWRFAYQAGAAIPINPQPIVSGQVEYELHPGHKISFYEFGGDITVPSIDFHTTDNYTIRNSLIATNLIDKFAATAEMFYNVNIPGSDFKFGNYWEWDLSLGLLILPRVYESYDDINLNIYSESKAYYFEKNEFQGSDISNSGGFRLDTYVGLQAIFFSSLMAELSYMIPVHSNEYVESQIATRSTSLLLSLRYLFFL